LKPFVLINMFGRKKSGIVIRTFVGAGRYQHDVKFFGDIRAVSQEVADMLQKVNERLYEYMPQESDKLISRIEYKHLDPEKSGFNPPG